MLSLCRALKRLFPREKWIQKKRRKPSLKNDIYSIFLYFTLHWLKKILEIVNLRGTTWHNLFDISVFYGSESFGIFHPKMVLNNTIYLIFLYFCNLPWLKKILEFVALKWCWIAQSIWYFDTLQSTMVEENLGICRPEMVLNNAIYLIFLYFDKKWWNIWIPRCKKHWKILVIYILRNSEESKISIFKEIRNENVLCAESKLVIKTI